MSILTSFLRNLVRDLVERRLWPVALVLVAALVAVPVVLGRGGPQEAPAPLPTPAAPATGAGTAGGGMTARAAIAIDESAPVRRTRDGKLRNPFTSPAAPKPAATSSTDAPSTAPSPGGASTGAPTSGGQSTPSPTPPSSGSGSDTPTTTPKPASKPKADDASDTYHVSLRFGETGRQETLRDIARLTPLPSVENPFFGYLGVLEDGETAVFLVSSDAVPTGDGTCRPSAARCETIELKAGDTEFFDHTGPDGVVTQYQMDLLSVRKTEVQAIAKAAMAYERHSNAGAELLRDAAVRGAAAGARSYRYVPERGVLVRAKRERRARAAANALIPGAAEAVALLPRTEQPGIPVWHWDADKAQR
jgi:hypothetical protein